MERIKLNIQRFAEPDSVEIAFQVNEKDIEKSLNKITKGLNVVSSSLKDTCSNVYKVGKAFSTWKIPALTNITRQFSRLGTSLYKDFLTKAIDTSEELNLFNVVFNNVEKNGKKTFSKLGKEAIKFQNNLNEAFGTNVKETMRYQGLFQAMGESAGLSDETSALMSKNMTKLAYDLASLYNTTETKAAESLRAGVYAGQTKPLRNYGIDVTQTSYKPLMQELGLEKSVSELTQAEKEILRYISTLRQAKNAMGDFANTIESPANQLKVLRQQFYEMQAAIGNLFVGAFARILPYVNGIIMVIKALAKAIASFFGIEMKDYNTGLASYADDLDAYSDSLDDVSDSAGGASNSIKALKRQVLAFDQINNLTTPTPSSSSGGGGGASLGEIDERLLAALEEYDNGMDKVRMKAVEIRDAIMEWLGFTKEINAETGEVSFNYDTTNKSIDTIAKEIATNLGLMLNYYTNLINWQELGATIALGLNTAFGFIDSFVQTYDWENLGTKIADMVNKAIKDIDPETLGRTITDKLRIAILTLSGFIETFDFKIFASQLAQMINSAIKNIPIEDLISGLNSLANGIWTTIDTLLKEINWDELLGKIVELWKGLEWETKLLVLAPVIASAFKALFGSQVIQSVISEMIVQAVINGLTSAGISVGGATAGSSAAAAGGSAAAGGTTAAAGGASAGTLATLTVAARIIGDIKFNEIYEDFADITKKIINGEDLDLSFWDVAKLTIEGTAGAFMALFTPAARDLFMVKTALRDLNIVMNWFSKDTEEASKVVTDFGKAHSVVFDIIEKNYKEYFNELVETDKQQRLLKAATEKNYEEMAKIINESSEESAESVKNSLVEQTSNVEGALGNNLINSWTALAYGSRDKYKEGIKELPTDLQDKIQEATGVVVTATPEMAQKFADLSQTSEKEFMDKFNELPLDIQKELLPQILEKGGKIPPELQKGIDRQPDPKVSVETENARFIQDKLNAQIRMVSPNSIPIGVSVPSAWSIQSAINSAVAGLEAQVKLVTKGKANGGVFANGRWQPIQAYANGGLPSGGQLFMAREAGPELVGKIGKHTAVMNNNQIVDSVKAGVYEAVSAAMSNSNIGGIELVAHTDEGVVIDRINRITRQTGSCPIEV